MASSAILVPSELRLPGVRRGKDDGPRAQADPGLRFTILSHAGLAVECGGVTLLCDPWVIGSTYWRSWWNYPPVSRDLVDRLDPDFIYLTHVHWDHFQGISLRKFGKQTHILVPKAPDTRIVDDLRDMGFENVTELAHGETFQLGEDFSLTSYQFYAFTDSAAVIEADGVTLFNANDAKVMGWPLKQILRRHPDVDFVFRSHSSANSRLCYDISDDPEAARAVDDPESYARGFADFVAASGARYAIPFASNNCHLHAETYHFNDAVVTPVMVRDVAARHGGCPPVRIMVSGDSWSSGGGFEIADSDWFERREARIAEYREANLHKLEKQEEIERRARVGETRMARYFGKLSRAVPRLLRRRFRDNPIAYVLRAGDEFERYEVDLYRGEVRAIERVSDETHPIQIHTSAYVVRRCISADLFSHLPISKRVRYRVTAEKKRDVQLLNLLFNLYEYRMLPLRRVANLRFVGAWASRWRELGLYAHIALMRLLGRSFEMKRYLPARPPAPVLPVPETAEAPEATLEVGRGISDAA